MPAKKTNPNTKKWAYVGGALVLAGISAWGVGDSRKIAPENTMDQAHLQNSTAQISALPVTKEEDSKEEKSLVPKKYFVKSGDTLTAIAANHNIDVETILDANPNIGETIYPGEELKILPEKGFVYEVKAGDTLWRISRDYNVTVETLVKANKKPTDQLLIGENIFIPGARFSRVDSRNDQRAQAAVSRAGLSRLSWPVGGEISSAFGWRWGRFHSGIDIANEMGAPVMSAGSGKVIWAGAKGGYGYAVIIDHGNGYVSLYGHLDDYFVEKGQYVRKGQRIASVGNTGNSTGPHLHFEVIKDGEAVDPMMMLP